MQKVILSLFCPILVAIIIRVILFIIAFVLGLLGFIFNAGKEYVNFVSNIGTFDTFVWNESWLFWGLVVIITFVAEMIIWSTPNSYTYLQETGTDLKNNSEPLSQIEPKQELQVESKPYTNYDNRNTINNHYETNIDHLEEDERNRRNVKLQAETRKKHEEVLRKEKKYLAEIQAKRIFNPIIRRISLLHIAIWLIPVILLFIFFCLVKEGSGLSNTLGILMLIWLIIGGIIVNVCVRLHIKREIKRWQMNHPNYPCSNLPIKYQY